MFINDLADHTFTIRVDSVDELFAFSITIDYDAADILVLGAVSFDFLAHTGSSTARFLDWSTPGTVQADESILGINPQTTSSGQLLSVDFRVPTGMAGVPKRVPVIVSSCRMRDEINHTIDCEADTGWIYLYPAMVRTKVFLQGPFVPSTTSMHTLLRDADYPDQRTSPYTQDPVSYGRQLPPNVVDWVLVQLRSVYNGAVLASKSCFLRTDGLIVYPDSTALKDVPFDVGAGNYYIVVRHRNHLGIQSAAAVALGGTATLYDFTSAGTAAYGIQPMKAVAPGVFGMYSGDADSNGDVNATDFYVYWYVQNGTPYLYSKYADFDMNTDINAIDLVEHWISNTGTTSQIP